MTSVNVSARKDLLRKFKRSHQTKLELLLWTLFKYKKSYLAGQLRVFIITCYLVFSLLEYSHCVWYTWGISEWEWTLSFRATANEATTDIPRNNSECKANCRKSISNEMMTMCKLLVLAWDSELIKSFILI